MWRNPQENADLVTFTEEILNGKLHILCSEPSMFVGVWIRFWEMWMKSKRSIINIFFNKFAGQHLLIYQSQISGKPFSQRFLRLICSSFRNTPKDYSKNKHFFVRLFEILMVPCIAIVKMHTQHSRPSFRCSKSTIKILQLCKKFNSKHNRTSFDNAVPLYLFLSFNFRHVSYLVLVFLLSILNM